MSEQKGTRPPMETWAVVELMGHVRLAGHLTEEERFGVKLGRLEIPLPDGKFVTQYFGGASVYRISPVEESVARHVALNTAFMPVNRWELPRSALTHQTTEEEAVQERSPHPAREGNPADDDDDSGDQLDYDEGGFPVQRPF